MPQRHGGPVGMSEETHSVVSGDSLSKVALHYRSRGWTDLVDWQPIYRLTRERTGLWRDRDKRSQLDKPNLIHPGDLLIIPRSRIGYLTVISRINSIKQDALHRPSDAAAIKKQEEHFSEGLDLFSDAMIFVATAGSSALKAAKYAKLAKTVVGAAVKEALKTKTLAAVEMSLKITEYGAKSTRHEDVARYAKNASKVVHVADLVHGSKDFKNVTKELALKKKYWQMVGETVGQVVDVIDVAIEWTQPSKLSKGLIKLCTGVGVDETIEQAIKDEKRSREQLINMLTLTVSRLQREMQLVYHG